MKSSIVYRTMECPDCGCDSEMECWVDEHGAHFAECEEGHQHDISPDYEPDYDTALEYR